MADTGKPYIGKIVKFLRQTEPESAGVVTRVWSDTEVDLTSFSPGVPCAASREHVKKGDIDSGLPTWWENTTPR